MLCISPEHIDGKFDPAHMTGMGTDSFIHSSRSPTHSVRAPGGGARAWFFHCSTGAIVLASGSVQLLSVLLQLPAAALRSRKKHLLRKTLSSESGEQRNGSVIEEIVRILLALAGILL